MLQQLTIKNYALISSLEIKFNEGFSIITGETGAGKSILLGAVSMLLGQRADSSILKVNTEKCVIEGTFNISEYNLQNFFKENDIEYDTITIIRREIAENGKSRAFINDSPVNLTLLKDLGSQLLDIHSQHETLNLNNALFQLHVVDVLAQNILDLAEFRKQFNIFKNIQKELNEIIEKANQNKADFDYYQFQFNQINDAKLHSNEQEILENELQTLSHAEEIKRSLTNLSSILNSDGNSVIYLLKEGLYSINQIKKYYTKSNDLLNRLESCLIEMKDLASETENDAEKIEFSQERIEEINQRLDTIYSLEQKHRVSSIDDLLKIKDEYEAKLNEITSYDTKIEEIHQALKKQKELLQKISDKLTQNRKKVLPAFDKKIIEILSQLGMSNSQFKSQLNSLPEYTNYGKDTVSFLFSANKNIEMQEISRVASGGELSRLMLAIKSVICMSSALPTIIFDEIDTGISGEIADKMGNILKQMSKNMQVINITHLPQIAAKGDNHYFVYKIEDKKSTTTNIKLLNQSERINEIAKMLSGENLSEAALNNAKELLKI